MQQHSPAFRGAAALAFIATVMTACADPGNPTDPDPGFAKAAAPAPSPLATAAFDGMALELWPYTTYDFVTPQDPVNLLFIGNADPRTIRAALVGLDEDHSGFPFPFSCVWQDVPEGSMQAAYTTDAGWEGSAIQLACGDYDFRFHVRLFAAGDWTVGNAHVEVQIPGTTEHQVLSWETAELFVLYDLVRSGEAAPVGGAAINDAPAFRTIDPVIVGALASDPELAPLLDIACPPGTPVPWACDGSEAVGILTDGTASIVAVTGDPGAETGSFTREQTIEFDQAIPKQFCADPEFPYVYVVGPIAFREHWVLTPSNNYIARFEASGTLYLTPLNPLTGATGETYTATIYDEQRAMLTDRQSKVSHVQVQAETPADSPYRGTLEIDFSVGPDGMTGYSVTVTCGG